MTVIKTIRGIVIGDLLSFRIAKDVFTSNDYGVTRLETARKLLEEYIGLDVEDVATMQVIPAGDVYEVRLRGK